MKKSLVALALTAFAATAVHAKDIVDTAVAAGSFKTLATALQAAGLVDTLASPGPFTVFAPTDEAFAKVPKATLDALATCSCFSGGNQQSRRELSINIIKQLKIESAL